MIKKKYILTTSLVVTFILSLIIVLKIIIINSIPDVFYSINKEKIYFKSPIPFVNFKIDPTTNKAIATSNEEYECNLKLFNITFKNITLKITNRKRATPSGMPFGLKVFADGVMIVNSAPVETKNGEINPSEISSIKKGDVIISLNGKQVNTVEEVSNIIKNSNGKPITAKIIRGNLKFETKITPVKSLEDNIFRAGCWVRDSSSGIGMITFFIKNKNFFAGLGHGIRDIDTDKLIPLAHGEVMKAVIKSVTKPLSSAIGELRGDFVGNEPIGVIKSNDESGVYGQLNYEIESFFDEMDIALKQEVKVGPAKIISTVFGNKPQMYDINIERVDFNKFNLNKNLSISVKDKNLIEKTGGVVQGMSGSPIIQNNMIVGAVTHVDLNNPLKGWGIFAETMMNNKSFLEICT